MEGRKHDGLLREKGGDAFPYIAFLDARGEVVAKTWEPHTLQGFRETVARVRDLAGLDEKAATGDKAAAIDAAILRCDLGQITYGDLEELLEPLGEPSEAQRKAIKAQFANEEVATLQTLWARARDLRAEVVEDVVALHGDGAVPTRRDLRLWFWARLAVHAQESGAPAGVEAALRELEAVVKGIPALERSLEKFKNQLAALKKSKGESK